MRVSWAALNGALLLGAGTLSGCVAAAVPLVTGGLVATKAASESSGTRRTKTRRARPVRAAAPVSVQRPAAPLAPAEPSTMRPGITYAGTLPSPSAGLTPGGGTGASRPAADAGWTKVGRYVAGLPSTQTNSVLLLRGSTSETPAWSPCAGKPRAVLARLETAATQEDGKWHFTREPQQWLEALQTLEIPVIFTSPAPASMRPEVEGTFRAAGLAKLLDLGGLRLGLQPSAMPAERAAIATRFCIIAVAGQDAADFPNALLPETSPPVLAATWGAGWFRIPAAT